MAASSNATRSLFALPPKNEPLRRILLLLLLPLLNITVICIDISSIRLQMGSKRTK